ncbi:hypothetical protein [Anaeroselena agilis]|uniref:Uncharacterized protein n=1 Tax=Anaeroselena agilis TaxID=3063788 RepID=A0ABU3NWT7_9FIRM|nr:hypothetical protein [Selenomonadales bacterium 4137-cl]
MRKSAEYKQRENEICDKIREISDEVDQLVKTGKDATEALQRLEAALREFEQFRRGKATGWYY